MFPGISKAVSVSEDSSADRGGESAREDLRPDCSAEQELKRQESEYKKRERGPESVLRVQKMKKVQVGQFKKMTADQPLLMILAEVQFELSEKTMSVAMKFVPETWKADFCFRRQPRVNAEVCPKRGSLTRLPC